MPDDRRTGIRVNLTLPEEVVRVLDRIGAVTGVGRATMIRQLLEQTAPQMAESARALELMQQRNMDGGLALLGKQMRDMSGEAEQLSLDIKRERRRSKKAP